MCLKQVLLTFPCLKVPIRGYILWPDLATANKVRATTDLLLFEAEVPMVTSETNPIPKASQLRPSEDFWGYSQLTSVPRRLDSVHWPGDNPAVSSIRDHALACDTPFSVDNLDILGSNSSFSFFRYHF